MLGFIKKKLQKFALNKEISRIVKSINNAGGANKVCLGFMRTITKNPTTLNLFLCGIEPDEQLSVIRHEARFAAIAAMMNARKKLAYDPDDKENQLKLQIAERTFEYSHYFLTIEEKAAISEETFNEFVSEAINMVLKSQNDNIDFDYIFEISPYKDLLQKRRTEALSSLEGYKNTDHHTFPIIVDV